MDCREAVTPTRQHRLSDCHRYPIVNPVSRLARGSFFSGRFRGAIPGIWLIPCSAANFYSFPLGLSPRPAGRVQDVRSFPLVQLFIADCIVFKSWRSRSITLSWSRPASAAK